MMLVIKWNTGITSSDKYIGQSCIKHSFGVVADDWNDSTMRKGRRVREPKVHSVGLMALCLAQTFLLCGNCTEVKYPNFHFTKPISEHNLWHIQSSNWQRKLLLVLHKWRHVKIHVSYIHVLREPEKLYGHVIKIVNINYLLFKYLKFYDVDLTVVFNGAFFREYFKQNSITHICSINLI
jgi:hypothetical protein